MDSAENPLPIVYSGHIDSRGEVDRIRFRVAEGETYRIRVHSQQLGFQVDSVLRLVDPQSGDELARNDDASRNQFDASLDYRATADGEVELQVFDLLDGAGPYHAYSVTIDRRRPSVRLSLDSDHYQCQAGQSAEIPVTISRFDGFASRLRVQTEGLPAGVDLEAVVSEPKGDSAKSVKLKVVADKATTFQGPIQVVARAIDESGEPTGATFPARHALSDTIQVDNIWLTVRAAK
jgi:hypothetical protein